MGKTKQMALEIAEAEAIKQDKEIKSQLPNNGK
jgi:hypothetical protein